MTFATYANVTNHLAAIANKHLGDKVTVLKSINSEAFK